MLPTTCIPLLRSTYQDLTKSEQKIADYIIQNPAEVIHMTIAELAEVSQSAEITIFRFCKKLGFAGFQSLKMALAGDIFSPLESVSREVEATDTPEIITNKIFHAIDEALQDTLKIMNFKELERAIDAFATASKIDVYGYGGSAVIAADVEHRFMRFGIPIRAYSDSHLQIAAAALLQPGDLVLAISHTGASIDLLRSLELARKNKATIIALTSYIKSPITKLADICLNGIAQETGYRSEAMASRIIHLAILDALYTGVIFRKADSFVENMGKVRQAISKQKM